MRPLVLLTLAATLLAQTGVRPRDAAADYAARASGNSATVGATILTPDQAKKLFAVDLHKLGYTVVEVAVYPERDVEVAARDFLLKVGTDGNTVRPATPAAIAGRIDRKSDSSKPPKIPERVQVHGSETIGYETGPYHRGVYTDSRVGVGVGAPQPAPPPPPHSSKGKDTDALSVQVDLENQALPEGRFSKPVAGYLYFPVTLKKTTVELTWYGADAQVRLPMPAIK
jgi:hypothetical protein